MYDVCIFTNIEAAMKYEQIINSAAFELVPQTAGDRVVEGVKDTYRVKDGYEVYLMNAAARVTGTALKVAWIEKMHRKHVYHFIFHPMGGMAHTVTEDVELIAYRTERYEFDLETGEAAL